MKMIFPLICLLNCLMIFRTIIKTLLLYFIVFEPTKIVKVINNSIRKKKKKNLTIHELVVLTFETI